MTKKTAGVEPASRLDPSGMPAFPTIWGNDQWMIPGLSKREYFAGLALQGLVPKNNELGPVVIAIWAVQIADALLAELAKS